MKKFALLLSLVLVMLTFSACGSTSADETVSLRLANASAEDTVTGIFSNYFAERVYELTNGEVDITVYHNSALGDDTSIFESVYYGDIDFVVGNTAPQVNFISSLCLFDLPNVFSSAEVARTVFEDEEFMDLIRAEYEELGYELLGYADQGYRVMTSNKKIETLDDFKGIKIRTMENTYHMAYWSAIGASPSPMAYSEVYMGLQQGVIDAQENPYEVIVASKFYEQQQYVVNTNHLLHIISLVTTDNMFSKLTDGQQALVRQAAQEAIEWAREQADIRQEDRQATIEASGSEILDISDQLREDILEAAQGVYSNIHAEVGDDLYYGLMDAIERAEAQVG